FLVLVLARWRVMARSMIAARPMIEQSRRGHMKIPPLLKNSTKPEVVDCGGCGSGSGSAATGGAGAAVVSVSVSCSAAAGGPPPGVSAGTARTRMRSQSAVIQLLVCSLRRPSHRIMDSLLPELVASDGDPVPGLG